MKKEILSTIGFIALIGSVSLGSVGEIKMVCTTNPDLGESTVQMVVIDDEYYIISVFGESRNTYKAHYVVTARSGSRVQTVSVLTKFSDESTWNDMPGSFELTRSISINAMDNYSLRGPGGILGTFDHNTCVSDLGRR